MKARYLIIASLLFLGCSTPVFAQEKIDLFSSNIAIQQDSSIVVNETIAYDFGTTQHHGIYRDIPLHYQTSYDNYSLRIKDIYVFDGAGTAQPFTTMSQDNGIRIRIGDPNALITGFHFYVIQYHIEWATTFHPNYDELYWNVTGNNWQVPMTSAVADVTLPGNADLNTVTSRCYAGAMGATTACETHSVGKTLHFGQSNLAPGQGLTFVVQFPKGIVTEPTATQKAMAVIADNWPIPVTLLVFICMYVLWRKKGRDPRGRGTIVAEYDAPDHMTPLQVSAVLNGYTGTTGVSAEIISLAIQGYLKIKQDTDDYILQQLKPVDVSLPDYEQTLLHGLFGDKAHASSDAGVLKEVSLSGLKDTFVTTLSKIESQAMDSVVKQGYYPKNPTYVRAPYFGLGFVIGIAIIIASGGSPVGIGGAFVSTVIVIVFGWVMPHRTYQGVLSKEYILGLKEYLQVAEADRLKFHDAPEKKPEVFEKLLPYAMVLGVEKEWAGQFKDIYTQEPNWYHGTYPGGFNTGLFVGHLNSLSSKAGTVLSSAPSSGAGGGGFAGGGFGGGGGGSW